MRILESQYLAHYGVLHKSGRYPWGSGGTQAIRNKSFLDHVEELRRQGMSDLEISRGLNLTTTQLRAAKAIAKNQQKRDEIDTARRLRDKGVSQTEIGRRIQRNESYVRSLLAEGAKDKADVLVATSRMLKEHVAEKKFLDVGIGVETQAGVSKTRFNQALAQLKEEGYEIHNVPIPQLGTGKNTTTKVLVPEGTTWGDVMKNRDKIQQMTRFSEDGGRSYLGLHPPIKINPKRVDVVYGPEGGSKADGVIFVREGVRDVSLGKSRYAQVRVAVGDGHYIKGMAMYKDDLPPGVDLQFHTSKPRTPNKLDALKANGEDTDNPFGATVRQIVKRADGKEFTTDIGNRHLMDGTEKVTSAMNIVHEEGNWGDWSKTISTQMLSKQSPGLAKTQLDMTYKQHVDEFDRLSKLTNPTVKRTLLEKFGDETDSSAVHLDAAGINTRQSWHAILPISTMPETQIYAPRFKDGERVVLIRFPHAGTFEIPELTVNNNHPEAKKLLGSNPADAVGIHHSVAERLSGADFDGDTVLVIPNNSSKVKTTPALEGLKNFAPREEYRAYEGMPRMTAKQKGLEMGGISNLITDMQIQGASPAKLVRAVRHSMVVIDAERHHLNYRKSAKDNGIAALKEEYQGGKLRGASTLISRATATEFIPKQKPRPAAQGGSIDRESGKRVTIPTGEINFRTGKPRLEKVDRLAITDNAHTLLSKDGIGTPMERLYADHSNKLKDLANRARKESINIPRATRSESARKIYKPQVQSLKSKLFEAEKNAPLERQAQVFGGARYRMKLDANPNMDEAQKKRVKNQLINEARIRTGASKHRIVIDADEWEAIQAGAISDHGLREILKHADIETVRSFATPRVERKMGSTEQTRAKAMFASGATRAEVAQALGVSLTTLDTAITGSEQ